MNLMNFGREQLQNGMLNNMLEEVGIDDVGSFVNQFRNQANHEAVKEHEQQEEDYDEDSAIQHASGQQANWMSMGSSLFNQFSGRGKGGNGGGESSDMIKGAMNAYKMFSGGSGNSGGGGGGGGFLDNISSTYQNAQQMHAMYKQLDKNGDGKITAEDIQILLQEMGLGAVSPYLAKGLFQAVDQNHNGTLDFTDLMALASILKKLNGRFGTGE